MDSAHEIERMTILRGHGGVSAHHAIADEPLAHRRDALGIHKRGVHERDVLRALDIFREAIAPLAHERGEKQLVPGPRLKAHEEVVGAAFPRERLAVEVERGEMEDAERRMLLAFALVVVKPEVPHYDLRIGAARRTECQLEAARRQEVVGVQEHEVASPRQGDRAVAGACAARVFLFDDAQLAVQASLVLAQNRDRIVG